MFVQVIPRLRLLRNLAIFDYSVPPDLRPKIQKGVLVLVPFRQQMVWAVVIGLRSSAFQGKKIRQIAAVSHFPALPLAILDLLPPLARYYAVSPALLARFVFPEFLLKRSSVAAHKLHWTPERITFPRARADEVRSWSRHIDFAAFGQHLFHYFLEQERFVFYWSLIRRALQQNRQILLVVPQVQDIFRILKTFPVVWRDDVALWHGGKNKTEMEKTWERIARGQTHIVIGTAGSVWLPLARPGAIIVDQEQDEGHKQSQHNPRFDVHSVARTRAEKENIPLIFTSHWPTVSTLTQVKKSCSIQPEKSPASLTLSLINLTDEFASGSFHFLTQRLLDKVRLVLERPGTRLFFFFNKKGFARRLQCRDCFSLISCPHCDLPATLLRKKEGDLLICQKCSFSWPLPTSCPRCKGKRLAQKGFGVRRIAHDLQTFFPEYPVLCCDKESSAADDGTARLIVGTEFAFSRVRWPTINTLVLLAVDDFPLLGRWSATEIWTATLSRLLLLARSYGARWLIVQSFAPDQWWLRSLLAGDYPTFVKKELETRRQFAFPPEVEMIRFLCYAENQEKADALARQVQNRLNTLIDHKEITVFAPQPLPPSGRKYGSALLLKTPKPLLLDFSWLPEQCFLDRHPLII